MNILIQSRQTHLFFNLKSGKWVPDKTVATAFESSKDAIRVCFQMGLLDVQLVMQVAACAQEMEVSVQVA